MRWLAVATSEVETQLDELRILELQRAGAADRVATELGLPLGTSLEDLAAGAQPPWTVVLLDHRQALLSLTSELSALAETNRQLMDAGARAVESALANIGLNEGRIVEGRLTEGYDARGRSGALASGRLPGVRPAVVDRAL